MFATYPPYSSYVDCYSPTYADNSRLLLKQDEKPRLIAVVDTEEEFDWSKPFSRSATGVTHIAKSLWRLQEIYDQFSVQPVYVVDYPVASQAEAWQTLRSIAEEHRASIGAHLHPWVTPPFEEKLSTFNSYAGNLPKDLERAKLALLTDKIEQSFGRRPTAFKAGRFGVGPNTFNILSELGYEVDLSLLPLFDCSADGGPDFSSVSHQPFRDADSELLVLPSTVAFSGWLPGDPAIVRRWATTSWRNKLRFNAFLYRLSALQRVWLTPELFSAAKMKTVTKTLLGRGSRLFVISLHSSVVLPGGTPFAKDEAGVSILLKRLRDYFTFFFNELGGEPWTPEAALQHWNIQKSQVRSATAR